MLADKIPEHGREGYSRYYGYSFSPARPRFDRCGKAVASDFSMRQCGNKARYAPDSEGRPTRCGLHDPEKIEARKLKEKQRRRQARYERDMATFPARAERFEKEPLVVVLRAIEAGHNDPRSLAREALALAAPRKPTKPDA